MTLPQLPIIYEDDGLLVVDKPAGLVVNRAETVPGATIQDWMEAQPWFGTAGSPEAWKDPELAALYKSRSGMVHRLDKDTSGVLLLAKNPVTMIELMRQFRDRETDKTYLALVHGKFSVSQGIIKLPLGRSQGDRERFAVDPEGKESETAYEVVEYFVNAPASIKQKEARSYQGFSLVRLQPKTGRTHQIRVHMGFIKHPLVGDLKYVGRKRSRIDELWCKRQFLHAEKLCFTNPKDKKRVCYTSNLPADLETVLNALK